MEHKANALQRYLEEAKKALSLHKPLCIVMGNEAADLDSMASAVVYAWYRTASGKEKDRLVVPFIPIPREDFRLRTEATYLFGEAGISESHLLFAEDINLAALQAEGRLSLILVDHNKLGKAFAGLADCVIGILDHHQDEGMYAGAVERIIEPVGSTTTLVAEKVLKDIPQAVDRNIALLLSGTILLDTVNLDPAAGRVTPKDSAMAAALLPIAGKDQKTLFDRLQFEKFNVASLSTRDLLRKDYKEYLAGQVRYGMSSVLLSLEAWKLKDAHLAEELAQYAASNHLSLLIAMLAYTEPKFTRELVVYSPDPALFAKIADFLAKSDLGLATLHAPAGSDPSRYGWYAQANESYSRKKLQPVIQQFLEKV
jgi:exopolyphosphatase